MGLVIKVFGPIQSLCKVEKSLPNSLYIFTLHFAKGQSKPAILWKINSYMQRHFKNIAHTCLLSSKTEGIFMWCEVVIEVSI